MCGIVGIVGTAPVADRLLGALGRLEYRGYDSAGIATLDGGRIQRIRASGKLQNLASKLQLSPLAGTIGIGHTRWATHGGPTEMNAHPHATSRVAVVHNGIIENHRALLAELAADGYQPVSQTDSEVAAMLVTRELNAGATPVDAVRATIDRLRGAYALAFMFEGSEQLLIAARQGSPLALGHGHGEMFLGSDALALAPMTDQVTYLQEGDFAVVTPRGAQIWDRAGNPVLRPIRTTNATQQLVEKGDHPHFMSKEIHEQPVSLAHSVSQFLDLSTGSLKLPVNLDIDFARLSRLNISGCGTAYIAGLVSKYWFERYAHLPVDLDVASEFRYREPPIDPNGLSLFISQSGETADTLAALRHCAAAGQPIAAIINNEESTIAREADCAFPLLCGPEIGVASTKAFTSQLAVLACLAIVAGRRRRVLDRESERILIEAIASLPGKVARLMESEAHIATIARRLSTSRDALFLGRGSLFPIALEGALKLKEISYIHAEGYAAGELKHGPIALVDSEMTVVVIAPSGELFEKSLSNLEECGARGGRIVLVTDEDGRKAVAERTDLTLITLPNAHPLIAPVLAAVAVQMLAYHAAVSLGADVDKPRNLAKSVTVE
jgi:glucosamine--fructose-6-phosphate aminotransferase (isomerizing)